MIFLVRAAPFAVALLASEALLGGISCDFYYPLVSRVRNAAQIANEIAALFKTEFFNTIDPKRTSRRLGCWSMIVRTFTVRMGQ